MVSVIVWHRFLADEIYTCNHLPNFGKRAFNWISEVKFLPHKKVLRMLPWLTVYVIASEAKRSELARELPVGVTECTIVGKKTSHNSETKHFRNMVQ